jgi:inorganic pyrophosphatase
MVGKVNFLRLSAFGLFFLLFLTACRPKDYSKIPAYSNESYPRAVIEIPAGTNLKIAYSTINHRFDVEMDENAEKKINFLPYPVNLGFVPSTFFARDSEQGGDVIDILVISEKLNTGTVIDVIPLGILILKDDFITDYKVVGIPADPVRQVVRANSLSELNEKYPALTGIIEEWFLYSDLYENVTVLGWEDEHVARQFIDKWLVRKNNQDDNN